MLVSSMGSINRSTNSASTETLSSHRVAQDTQDPLITKAPPQGPPAILSTDPAKGSRDAAITLIEFGDFDCPFCAEAQAILKRVEEVYGDTVQFVWKDFPILELHPSALAPHIAARCAFEQDAFFPYKNMLYKNRNARNLQNFLGFAEDLELDTAKFQQCLGNTEPLLALMQSSLEEGIRYGVNGTPHFFVNEQELVGAVSFETLQKVIEAELR